MTIFSKLLTAGIIGRLNLEPILIESRLQDNRKKRAKATTIENLPQEVLEKMSAGFRLLVLMAYKEGYDFSYDAEKDIVVLSDPLTFTGKISHYSTRFAFEPKTGQGADDKLPPTRIPFLLGINFLLNGDLQSKAENGGFLSKRQVKIFSGDEEENVVQDQVPDDLLCTAGKEKQKPLIKV